MTLDLLFAFAAYAFVTSITPGPNNAMLLTSGVNFGFRLTVPHLLGINLGFSAMMLTLGFGAGTLFATFPLLQPVLHWLGAAYLTYLAWKIANSGALDSDRHKSSPMTLIQAAAFQWINPKAWIMAIGAITTYAPSDGLVLNILIVTLIFSLVNGPCIIAWAAIGTVLRKILSNPTALRAFNIIMATLLITSLYPIFAEIWPDCLCPEKWQ